MRVQSTSLPTEMYSVVCVCVCARVVACVLHIDYNNNQLT